PAGKAGGRVPSLNNPNPPLQFTIFNLQFSIYNSFFLAPFPTAGRKTPPRPPLDERPMMHPSTFRAGWLALLVALGLLALVPAEAAAQLLPRLQVDRADLPPRSLPGPVAERSLPRWVRTHLRIGHLPPGLGRMPQTFAKA